MYKRQPPITPHAAPPQGCRSVEEFQCLNRIEEGTYGVVYRAKDKKTGGGVPVPEGTADGAGVEHLQSIVTWLTRSPVHPA